MEVDNFLRILTTSPGGKVFVKENIFVLLFGVIFVEEERFLGEPERGKRGKKEKGMKERGFIDILGWGSVHKRSGGWRTVNPH